MLNKALDDLLEGTKQHEIWGRLGWIEIQRRYRRTAIGPFWTTLSVGLFIFPLGFLWSNLWGVPIEKFLPHLTCGIVVWTLMMSMINEGCVTFVASRNLMLTVRVPLSVLAYAVVWRNMIVLFHNMLLVILVLVIFQTKINLNILYLLPALAVLFVSGLWVAILLGGVCSRFHDIQQFIVSSMGILMFCTPVLWDAAQLGPRGQFWIQFNIFYHFVEIFRAPLLGNAPTASTWIIVVVWTLLGWVAAIAFISKFRKRIAYWL